MEQNRHACTFSGCTKSFIRKEHLTRHVLTHSEAKAHVCHLCQRSFTRNDVLQRHVSRHTAVVDETERNKDACQACHKAKTRCAGGIPCKLCSKKGITCKLDPRTKNQRSLGTAPFTTQNPLMQENGPWPIQNSQDHDTPDLMDIGNLIPSPEMTPPLSAMSIFEQACNIPAISMDAQSIPRISKANSGYLNRTHACPLDREAGDIYFSDFQHRWPIFHGPSYDERATPAFLNHSIMMIGNWLKGSEASQNEAMEIHNRLMGILFPKLTVSWKPNAEDSKSWPVFQASALNIIFAFYTQDNECISRAAMMLNALICVLRGVGLFRPETVIPTLKANTFPPWAMILTERRKRLAMALYKIDAYNAMLRGQPPLLRAEEMHFPLTITYSLWSRRAMGYFQQCLSEEPIERGQMTMVGLIKSPLENKQLSPFVSFPEDIQMGICSLQSKIGEFIENCRDNNLDNATVASKRQLLVQQLNYWKQHLDEFSVYDVEEQMSADSRPARAVPDSCYWGLEDRSKPGWKDIVLARPSSLVFDTNHLYHLFNIYIHADVYNLCNLANAGDNDNDLAQQHTLAATKWAATNEARQALMHAYWILKIHRADAHTIGGVATEPVNLIALNIAALVVCAFVSFKQMECGLELGHHGAWREVDEEWIRTGGPASMDGLPLCKCLKVDLVRKF